MTQLAQLAESVKKKKVVFSPRTPEPQQHFKALLTRQ